MGKSTISMAILNSYVKLPEGTIWLFIGGYTTQYIGDYNNPNTGNPYKTNLIVMGIVMGIVMDGIVTLYFLTTKLIINPIKSTINGHFSRLFFLLRNRGTLRCLHPSLHGLRGQMVRVRGPLFWALGWESLWRPKPWFNHQHMGISYDFNMLKNGTKKWKPLESDYENKNSHNYGTSAFLK